MSKENDELNTHPAPSALFSYFSKSGHTISNLGDADQAKEEEAAAEAKLADEVAAAPTAEAKGAVEGALADAEKEEEAAKAVAAEVVDPEPEPVPEQATLDAEPTMPVEAAKAMAITVPVPAQEPADSEPTMSVEAMAPAQEPADSVPGMPVKDASKLLAVFFESKEFLHMGKNGAGFSAYEAIWPLLQEISPDVAEKVRLAYKFDPAKVTLGKVVAKGGQGQLIEGWFSGIGVAVKISLTDGASIQKEADLLASVGKHRNIVEMIGVGKFEVDGVTQIGLCLRMYENGSLDNFLEDRISFKTHTLPLTNADLIQASTEILLGLQFLNGKGIIHSDIASRNVLVDMNFVCVIVDFGLGHQCKFDSILTQIYVIDKPEPIPVKHASPERLSIGEETHTVDARSDLYSWGMTVIEIYLAVKGETLYAGMTLNEIRRAVLEGNMHPLPFNMSSPELRRAVKGVRKLKPEDRLTAEQIVDSLLSIESAPSDSSFVEDSGKLFSTVSDFRDDPSGRTRIDVDVTWTLPATAIMMFGGKQAVNHSLEFAIALACAEPGNMSPEFEMILTNGLKQNGSIRLVFDSEWMLEFFSLTTDAHIFGKIDDSRTGTYVRHVKKAVVGKQGKLSKLFTRSKLKPSFTPLAPKMKMDGKDTTVVVSRGKVCLSSRLLVQKGLDRKIEKQMCEAHLSNVECYVQQCLMIGQYKLQHEIEACSSDLSIGTFKQVYIVDDGAAIGRLDSP